MPDKAIDLVDEAASRLKMEIDSLPEPIDQMERKLTAHLMEQSALAKEHDEASRKRLAEVEAEIAELRERAAAMKLVWQREKEVIGHIQKLKEEIEAAKTESQLAQRKGDLNRAAELRFGRLPELEKQLVARNQELKSSKNAGSFLREEVTEEDIASVVSKWTGIPVSKRCWKVNSLADSATWRTVYTSVSLAKIRRSRPSPTRFVARVPGCRIPTGPSVRSSFLARRGSVRPRLARALAEFLFDDETHMVRIDMSEYMEKHTVSRLIGAPPGYVGYDEGGQLTEAVRRRPYSVVLFDEIEKAHADVFNALLQLLDDGRLTDGQGRTVDFRNTVIIMTSNVGSHRLLGAQPDVDAAMEELRHTFRPEFLNRVDEIVVFERLTREDIDRIVDLQMARFQKLLVERDLSIELLPEARTFLAEKGYDPTYGARPLKRTLMAYLQNPLAKQLIAGAFLPGDTIVVGHREDGLEFHRKVKETASRSA